MPEPTVCISIVTFNSSRYIRRCLNAALAQKGIRATIVVVDNASADGTAAILKEFGDRIQVIWNRRNVGFAEAQNQGIRSSRADWVLTLNPDLLMEEDFVRRLVDAGELDRGAGAVCGKLLSIGPGFQRLAERRIDSTGLFFTPTMRHFDRGWHEPDDGAYDQAEYVFGASAAAALYRREMIDDVSIGGRLLRPGFLCLPGRCRRGLAGATAWLAVHLHAGGGGLARAQRGARGAAVDHAVDQYALGEESLPDAHQECDARALPALLAADDGARPGGGGGVSVGGTAVAAGILAGGEVLAGDLGAAARDHEPAAGQRRGTDALVPV